MNSRKNIGTALVVVVIAAAIWWFGEPVPLPVKVAVTAATKSLVVPESQYSIDPKSAALHPPPSAPFVPPPAQPHSPQPPGSSTAVAYSLGELKSALPDIARLYGNHDMVELYRIYTPPDQADPQKLQQLQEKEQELKALFAQDPFAQRITQKVDAIFARSWEDLENQTPTLNAAGDEATYTRTVDTGVSDPRSVPVTFVKINGKWYIKPEGG